MLVRAFANGDGLVRDCGVTRSFRLHLQDWNEDCRGGLQLYLTRTQDLETIARLERKWRAFTRYMWRSQYCNLEFLQSIMCVGWCSWHDNVFSWTSQLTQRWIFDVPIDDEGPWSSRCGWLPWRLRRLWKWRLFVGGDRVMGNSPSFKSGSITQRKEGKRHICKKWIKFFYLDMTWHDRTRTPHSL